MRQVTKAAVVTLRCCSSAETTELLGSSLACAAAVGVECMFSTRSILALPPGCSVSCKMPATSCGARYHLHS